MDSLLITLAEVSHTSMQIRQENQQLSNCLKDIHQCMNQITNEWQSPAAQTIRTKFQGMIPIFDHYREIVENYAKFLDQTVQTYQSIEDQLNSHAQSFQ
ncbi:pore-forming ESAT-6 family protein [Amedibacillus sp. YH-ame6]